MSNRYEFLSKLKRKSIEGILGFKRSNLRPFYNSHIVLENGYNMSVQCGYYYYSTPKEDMKNIKNYTAFEVACFDNRSNWIAVRLQRWGNRWRERYDGFMPDELFNIVDGHARVQYPCIMPYLPIEEVESLYQYLKRQKRKFVIIEKYKKPKYEEQD